MHRLVAFTVALIILNLALQVCSAYAQIRESVVLSFTGTGGGAPGSAPYGTLIADSTGNLYGTTLRGGRFNAGVVFKLDAARDYAEVVLHTFTGNPRGDGDGGFPAAGLVMDADGNLYGTTTCGGNAPCDTQGVGGDGVIYRITPAESYAVLYKFKGGSDGSRPYASLLRVGTVLYGTTTHGGLTGCTDALGAGCGTAFKFPIKSGRETVFYRFTGGNDGGVPYAPLVRDRLGRFVGTTWAGGLNSRGTIFSLTAQGAQSVLYHFRGSSDGGRPFAGLSVDSANNLYGTASCGGTGGICPRGRGVVFVFSAATFQTLHSFAASPDGAMPIAGVILDSAKNLCGTTFSGGAASMGTLFTLTSSSGYAKEIRYDFLGAPQDGAFPYAGLLFDPLVRKRVCPGTAPVLDQPSGKGVCNYACGAPSAGGAANAGAVVGAQ